jgi:protein SCO1/2
LQKNLVVVKSKKILIITAFFLVTILGFYFVVTAVIPEFTNRKYMVISYVRPFEFINQDSNTVTQQDVLGKVYVAEFFFSTCPGICPIMNRNMKEVYEAFKEEKDFVILTHTVDPDTDTPSRLKFYADSLGVSTEKWWFLTGSKDSLYHAARVSYLVDDPQNHSMDIEEQFLHTQFFALVDKQGQVRRKIYDGLKKKEVKELMEDIRVLLDENDDNPVSMN